MKYLIPFVLISTIIFSQDKVDPKDLEFWEPEPKIVEPYKLNGIPSDAIILFDGSDFSKWKSERIDQEVLWSINNDRSMTINPGTGGIETIEEHGSIQLHIEWKTGTKDLEKHLNQSRSNSGIFFQKNYEIQILDSYNNPTYVNGQAGSVYKQHIPLKNTSKKPGDWQSYDIIFTAPIFKNEKLEKPGYFTVFHNGVLIQNHVEIKGTTCLLYTSDAADEEDSIDLGGRRIIKNKNTVHMLVLHSLT